MVDKRPSQQGHLFPEVRDYFHIVPVDERLIGIAEIATGDIAVTVCHPWMAEKVVSIANEFGPDRAYWKFGGTIERRIRGLACGVPCPTCRAQEGSACMRPSGHPLMGGKVHSSRRDVFDDWLISQDSLAL